MSTEDKKPVTVKLERSWKGQFVRVDYVCDCEGQPHEYDWRFDFRIGVTGKLSEKSVKLFTTMDPRIPPETREFVIPFMTERALREGVAWWKKNSRRY